MIEEAKRYAIEAHKDQKYGEQPYSVHLESVVKVLTDCGVNKPEKLAAGWLHDVIEDTGIEFEDIVVDFGPEVAGLVFACTGIGENRKARNACIYEKIAKNPAAADIKVADRIANVEASRGTSLAKMYAKERWEFHENVANYASAALVKRLVKAYER